MKEDRKLKKKVSLILILIFTLAMTVGCGTMKSTKKEEAKETPKTRVVVDSLGRKVTIPYTVKKIIPLANALRIMAYADCLNLVAGVEEGEKEKSILKAYNWVNFEQWKELPIVGKGGSGGYTPFIEEIVLLAPDVIICGYTQKDAEELQNKTGIPVVIIEPGNLFGEDYNKSLMVIGDVCNVKDKCEKIVSYINEVKKDLNKRTETISATEKVTSYSGAMNFKGGHGIEGTYVNFPIFRELNVNEIIISEKTEASGVTIEKEKILASDPKTIFLDPGNLKLVKDDFAQNKAYYQSLSAYKTGDIYSLIGYNFYYTNVEIALADSYYVGKTLYPEAFKDINPEKKAAEIFKLFLGSTTYYQEIKEAGYGFGKLSIGE